MSTREDKCEFVLRSTNDILNLSRNVNGDVDSNDALKLIQSLYIDLILDLNNAGAFEDFQAPQGGETHVLH